MYRYAAAQHERPRVARERRHADQPHRHRAASHARAAQPIGVDKYSRIIHYPFAKVLAEVRAEFPGEPITAIQPVSVRILDSQDGYFDEGARLHACVFRLRADHATRVCAAEVEAIWVQDHDCDPTALESDVGNATNDVAFGVLEDKPECVYGGDSTLFAPPACA
jgi:hypothetical protein